MNATEAVTAVVAETVAVSRTEYEIETLIKSLRRRVCSALPIALDGAVHVGSIAPDFASKDVADLLRLGEERRAGFWADDVAMILARVYQREGLKSAVLRLGDPTSSFTHSVTLVRFRRNGEPCVSIQDAYYDFTILDHDKGLADYLDVVRCLNDGDFTTFCMVNESASRDLLSRQVETDVPKIEARNWYWGDPAWMEWLGGQFGSRDLVNCLRLPFEIRHAAGDASIFEECVEAVVRLGTPAITLDTPTGAEGQAAAVTVADATSPTAAAGPVEYTPEQAKILFPNGVVRVQFRRILERLICPEQDFKDGEHEYFKELHTSGNWMTVDEAESLISLIPKSVLESTYRDDQWMLNLMLNAWEFARGSLELESHPWNISLPVADICNARCTFCTSWLEGRKVIPLEKVEAFEPLIRSARLFGLAGHGEPLVHPQITELLDRFASFLDRRASAYLITNGVRLADNIERLLAARVRTFNISLNAASAPTHQTVMGLGVSAFDKVVEGVRLARQRLDEISPGRGAVNISFVVTQQNMHELPAFVRLGAEVGVNQVLLKTLAGQTGITPGLNYHLLPPYLHPEYERLKEETVRTIEELRGEVGIIADPDSWDVPIYPPKLAAQLQSDPPPTVLREDALASKEIRSEHRSQTKFSKFSKGEFIRRVEDHDGENPFDRTPRFSCRAVYQNLYINDFSYQMVPCCYMATVPGHRPVIYDGSYPFKQAWNSPAMMALRRRLKEGPLFRMCTRCPAVY